MFSFSIRSITYNYFILSGSEWKVGDSNEDGIFFHQHSPFFCWLFPFVVEKKVYAKEQCSVKRKALFTFNERKILLALIFSLVLRESTINGVSILRISQLKSYIYLIIYFTILCFLFSAKMIYCMRDCCVKTVKSLQSCAKLVHLWGQPITSCAFLAQRAQL